MDRRLLLILISVLMIGLSSCNTIGGAGKDIRAAGHDVTKAAMKVQQNISN